MAIVHPADQERIFNGIGNILSGNSSPMRHEFRIVKKRWFYSVGGYTSKQHQLPK